MKKFTWGHGIALALGSFMIFILGIIFFGARILFPDGNDNSDLVSDNYYENELAYQKVIDAKKNADNLPQKPQYAQLAEGIKITFPQEILNANSKVDFYLYRANDKAQDRSGTATLDQNGNFFISKNLLNPGNYILKVNWNKDNKDYQVDYDVVWK